MIRPVAFRKNEETTVNNYYQKDLDLSVDQIQQHVHAEFDSLVTTLRHHGVKVIVIDDTATPSTPDSIFPNNWVSFHADGRVALYPMFAPNRRQERRQDIVELLREDFTITRPADFTMFEREGMYLEGTGSMILDREHSVAYAAISERTDEQLFEQFCDQFWYDAVAFTANQTVAGERKPIYHTNVMMCLTSQVALICLDSIDSTDEKERLLDRLSATGKTVIDITEEQVNHFVGNALEVTSGDGNSLLVMSSQAFNHLTDPQKTTIEKYHRIVHTALDTIEALGGGSARCMMAEVFLPRT